MSRADDGSGVEGFVDARYDELGLGTNMDMMNALPARAPAEPVMPRLGTIQQLTSS